MKTVKFVFALLVTAIIGGIIALILTKAIPKIISETMFGMMSKMCDKMKKDGKDPRAMCKKMMED